MLIHIFLSTSDWIWHLEHGIKYFQFLNKIYSERKGGGKEERERGDSSLVSADLRSCIALFPPVSFCEKYV